MVVLIGAQPQTEWLPDEIDLDAEGFILTGPQLGTALREREPWKTLGREPFLVEASRPGAFAVGDVRSGSTKMVAPAAGDGGMAIRFCGPAPRPHRRAMRPELGLTTAASTRPRDVADGRG